jgi:hypothetical protein
LRPYLNLLVLAVLVVSCASPVPSALPSGSEPARTIADFRESASPTTTERAVTASPAPSSTPSPTPSPKPLTEPPPPSGVDFFYRPSGDTVEITVTWEKPTSAGTTIRVYGVALCYPGPAFPGTLPGGEDSEFGPAGPCLVKGTPLPDRVRQLIGEVPASRRMMSWTSTWVPRDDLQWSPTGPDDSTFAAIVIRASNDAGNSKFIIAEPGMWCSDCVWSGSP